MYTHKDIIGSRIFIVSIKIKGSLHLFIVHQAGNYSEAFVLLHKKHNNLLNVIFKRYEKVSFRIELSLDTSLL